LKLIKRIYNPETNKQDLISEESAIYSSIEIHKSKKPRILQDIINNPSITLNCSLEDFM